MAAALTANALALLRGPFFATVSTLRADGTIQSVITWADADEEGRHVLLNTAEGRAWWKNLKRDPRVTVTVAGPGHAQFLSITGRVVDMTNDGADEHIDRLEAVYTGHPEYRGRALWPEHVRTTIVIEPDRVTHYGA
jgi:PPOX class probable F420-dependent enzyme